MAAVLSKLAVFMTNLSLNWMLVVLDVVTGYWGMDTLLFSRVRFLAKSRISSTFCSPILLDSEPGLKVACCFCLVIRYEVLPVRALLNKEFPGLGSS